MADLEKVLSWLTVKGLKENDIEVFRFNVEIPHVPFMMASIIRCLHSLLGTMHDLSSNYSDVDLDIDTIFCDLKHVCKILLNFPKIEDYDTKIKPKRPLTPMWGYYESNPIYAALWHMNNVPVEQNDFLTLASHVFISIFYLKQIYIENGGHALEDFYKESKYGSNIHDALLALRKLSVIKDLKETLGFTINRNPNNLCIRFEQTPNDYKPIGILIKYAIGLKRPPSRSELPKTEEARSVSNVEDLFSEKGIILTKIHTISRAEAKERERIGCSPHEDGSGIEYMTWENNKSGPQSRKHPLDTNFIKNHLSMSNQHLPLNYGMLTPFEIARLFEVLLNIQDHTDLWSGYNYKELRAFLGAMFFMGQSIEKTAALVCHPILKNIDFKHPQTGLVNDFGKTCFWLMVPATPKRTVLPNSHAKSVTFVNKNYFFIHSSSTIEDTVFLEHLKDRRRSKPTKLFEADQGPEGYTEMVRTFCSRFNKKFNARLTAKRISWLLFQRIVNMEGADRVTATYLTGNHHFLAQNPSYYTTIPGQKLQAIYCKAIRQFPGREAVESNLKFTAPPSSVAKMDWNVGSPFTPTTEGVQKLVSEWARLLRQTKKLPESVEKLSKVHFYMTAYTAYMSAYAIGYRGVHEPIPLLEEIDSSGFAVISDKDSEDRYKSRLVWLPPVLAQQLKLFWEHTSNILAGIELLEPGFQSRHIRTKRGATSRLIVFLSGKGGLVDVTAKNLSVKFEEIFPLPFNAARHYLRTCLLQRECPAEIINAYMGHWERGEEPWSGCSGLSPSAYRNALIKYLCPILEHDGWTPIPGWK